jgi:hypothetical protein
MDERPPDPPSSQPPMARALAVFRQPLVWAAIGLLVVNDHVLKTAAPGWLTGKLSDFAGLFFFPLLLAVPIAAILPRRAGTRAVGVMAFGLTAVWFAAIKTVAPANDLTAGLVGTVLGGGPARIALDPTDLVALAALWPAWRLWRRLPAPADPVRWPRRAVGTIALGVAALATMATSPPPHAVVTRLAVDGGKVYASGKDMGIERSEDGGESWQQEHQWSEPGSSARGPQALYTNRPSPVVQCVPGDPRTCYRTAPAGRVEVSRDGGVNWSTAWALPRQDYMRRLHDSGPPVSGVVAEGPFDPGPHDLVVLPQGGGYRLIVALGSEGVVVRTPDGEWAQWPTTMAYPTPPRADSLNSVLATSLWPFLAALVATPMLGWVLQRRTGRHTRLWPGLMILSVLAIALAVVLPFAAVVLPVIALFATVTSLTALAVAAASAMRGTARRATGFALGAAGTVVVFAGALWFTSWLGPDPFTPWYGLVVVIVVICVGLIAAVVRTQRTSSGGLPTVQPAVLGAAGALFLAIWGPFVLWAVGILPTYSLAALVAAVAGAASVGWGWQSTALIDPPAQHADDGSAA